MNCKMITWMHGCDVICLHAHVHRYKQWLANGIVRGVIYVVLEDESLQELML